LLDSGKEAGSPTSRSSPIRLEGVVRSRPGCELSAPFSGRPCVLYSASVSHGFDGVCSPPLAYRAAQTDFLLEVGCFEVFLTVQGREAALFDMAEGLQAHSHAFASAPPAWQSFVLAHLAPSATEGEGVCADLGPAGATLEFRECALLTAPR